MSNECIEGMLKCLLIKVFGVINVYGNNRCDDILICVYLFILY